MADHKIQWNGLVDDSESDSLVSADNNEVPTSVDIVWSGYKPCWYPANHADCVIADMYFEDFDVDTGDTGVGDGVVDALDTITWVAHGRSDIAQYLITTGDLCEDPNASCINDSVQAGETTYLAPKTTYTWNDLYFLIEIADGIGTGNRRAREARLQQLDKDKKKRLIRLICRVKGEETAYDETKEVGDIQLKLDDVDMVINKVVGTMKVSTEWEEVDWDYGYDK